MLQSVNARFGRGVARNYENVACKKRKSIMPSVMCGPARITRFSIRQAIVLIHYQRKTLVAMRIHLTSEIFSFPGLPPIRTTRPLRSAAPAYSLNVRIPPPSLSYTCGSLCRSSLPTALRSGAYKPCARNFSSTRISGWKEIGVDGTGGAPGIVPGKGGPGFTDAN